MIHADGKGTGRGRRVEILFRMLEPHELAAAMGLDGYDLAGHKGHKVRQIGNAVPVRIAQALVAALFAEERPRAASGSRCSTLAAMVA